VPSVKRSATRTGSLVLATVALLGACSSKAEAQYKPAEAATAIQKVVGLSPDQTNCLKGKFEADPSIAVVLNKGVATKEVRDAYVVAIRACVPVDVFVELMITALQELFAGGDDAQAACLRTTLQAITPAEQDLFYVYFSNPGAVDVLEVDPITKRIASTCHLDATGEPFPFPSTTGTLAPG